MALLSVENLKTWVRSKKDRLTIVDGVSFTVDSGETVGIVGESGCGKSMTSLAIMRLLASHMGMEGKILFNGTDMTRLSAREMRSLRGNQIAMIFQEPMSSLNPLQPIGKQITEPLRNHLKLSSRQSAERAVQLLQEVGIPRPAEIYREYPHQLSGGMRQRVMIAIAMACKPKLMIADEPTTALDVTIQAQILELLKTLQKANQTAIILVTHDLGVVAEMCDRVLVMYAGQIVEEADVHTLFRSPKHPYTVGLMKSMPSMSQENQRLSSIPGTVPAVGEMPPGCRFAPRCAQAMDICHLHHPELEQLANQHRCRCWLYEDRRASDETFAGS